MRSVFNQPQQQQSILQQLQAYRQPQKQFDPYSNFRRQAMQTPRTDSYFNKQMNPNERMDINSEFNMDDMMKYGQGAVDIGSGLMGIKGAYDQNQMGKAALGMAREDQAMRKNAANQYSQFRQNTINNFA